MVVKSFTKDVKVIFKEKLKRIEITNTDSNMHILGGGRGGLSNETNIVTQCFVYFLYTSVHTTMQRERKLHHDIMINVL